MEKELVNKPEIKLVGLTARTNNKNEFNPQTAKIGELVGRFQGQNIASQIPDRKNPGVTLSAFAEYDSDEHGDYTYFIGEEVNSFENIPANLQKLTIPAARYQKFTTPSGKMPEVVINAWQKIWKMTSDDFGGNRAYIADFEVYDQRAADPARTVLDIYIGIK
ncbi:MAG TPA: GyrI-like domain-containing protein [Gammaproteobacteria bacterium]|nr:GyrI-like domain-containing protein [Gammaproteobacteria bacterium]